MSRATEAGLHLGDKVLIRTPVSRSSTQESHVEATIVKLGSKYVTAEYAMKTRGARGGGHQADFQIKDGWERGEPGYGISHDRSDRLGTPDGRLSWERAEKAQESLSRAGLIVRSVKSSYRPPDLSPAQWEALAAVVADWPTGES